MTKRIISLLLAVALSLSLIVGGFVPSFSASAAVDQQSTLNFASVLASMPDELRVDFESASGFENWFSSPQITVLCCMKVEAGLTYLCVNVAKISNSNYRYNYYNDGGVVGFHQYNSRYQSYSTAAIGSISRFVVSFDSDSYSVIGWDDYSSSSGGTTSVNTSGLSDSNVFQSGGNCMFSPSRESSNLFYWSSRDFYNGSSVASPILYSSNLVYEELPSTVEFDAVVFDMGSRLYLTTSDFHILSGMDPEKDDTVAAVGWYNYDTDSSDVFTLDYGDLVQVYHPPVSPGTISNIPADGHVYCFDITSWPSGSWLASFSIYYKDDHSLYAEAVNLPLDLSLEDQPSVDYYSIANYYYNQYVTQTDNIDPIVLEDLVEELYGVKIFASGSAWFAPSQSVDQNSDNGYQLSRWGFYDSTFSGADQPSNNSLINYSLLNVAIVIPVSVNYELRPIVIYSGSQSTSDSVVSKGEYSFSNILTMCDAVFFVDRIPDDTVDGFHWPDFMYPAAGSPNLTSYAFLCSYYDQAAYSFSTSFHGHCIVLDQGVQKSMLYNFSDGIRKIYDFLQGYVENHNNWISSQILWQSGLFNELQSIVGKLNSIDTNVGSILSSLQSVVDKLQIIADNTSESEHGFWYLPLFNFINRFKPSDSDFSSAIEAIDNTWEQLSPIPAAPSPPLIPTLYPVNTPALPGG